MDRDEQFMSEAIRVALGNRMCPFGAVLVDSRRWEVVAEGLNRTSENPTWHGEIEAINAHSKACTIPDWNQLFLYSTAEPCPMCQSAILWAGISRVVYGTSVSGLMKFGWNQIEIGAEEVAARTSFTRCTLRGGVMQTECDALFRNAVALRVARS